MIWVADVDLFLFSYSLHDWSVSWSLCYKYDFNYKEVKISRSSALVVFINIIEEKWNMLQDLGSLNSASTFPIAEK